MTLADVLEPSAERPRTRLVDEGEHPIHAWWRLLDGLDWFHMPPLARLVLQAVIAEGFWNADGKLLASVSLESLWRSTGLWPVELRSVIASLTAREWLFPLDESVTDDAVQTAYQVSLSGKLWKRGSR